MKLYDWLNVVVSWIMVFRFHTVTPRRTRKKARRDDEKEREGNRRAVNPKPCRGHLLQIPATPAWGRRAWFLPSWGCHPSGGNTSNFGFTNWYMVEHCGSKFWGPRVTVSSGNEPGCCSSLCFLLLFCFFALFWQMSYLLLSTYFCFVIKYFCKHNCKCWDI